MPETAINLPLDGSEIRQIILERLEKRMALNSLLAAGIAYPGFKYDLTFTIALEHPHLGATVVWDRGQEGEVGAEPTAVDLGEKYVSETPNIERQDHGLPLTVEAIDAKGKKAFKKVKIKT